MSPTDKDKLVGGEGEEEIQEGGGGNSGGEMPVPNPIVNID
jgi:hypothetical protein